MTISQIKLLAQAASTILGLTLMASIAHGDPRDSIVLDPITGDYTITYAEPGESNVYRMLFIPATKISPSVRSSFKRNDSMNIIYRYRVKNGKASKQYLVSIRIDPASDIIADQPLPRSFVDGANKSDDELLAEIKAGRRAVASPSGWKGAAHPSRPYGLRISWGPTNMQNDANNGLRSGRSLSGLGFASKDLPGIGDMQFEGDVHYPDDPNDDGDERLEPTSEVGKRYQAMTLNDFVRRPAAVPTITVPTPFDPALLLERTQTHVHTWIAMKLLDPAFSTQLDSFFQAAIDAYRLNQTDAARKHLQAMRRHLKQEHADADKEDHGDHEDDRDDDRGDDHKKNKTKRVLIDKLAARILDFNLKYVLKRTGGDD